MSKAFDEIMVALAAPFPAADVDWRIQHTNVEKTRGLVVPYVKSRAIQSRLDAVVGPFNWKAEYKPWHNVNNTASQLCGIAIYCQERSEWIQKWDGARNTDIEPIKGGISDSFKRAAVLWGIGRYLYSLAAVWTDLETKGKNPAISDKAIQQLHAGYEKAVNAPPSNVAPFPSGNQNQATTSQQSPDFEYSVSSIEPRKFASGDGMVLRLKSADGKKSVEAFLQKADQNLIEGICLKNVKLTSFNSGGYNSNIMERYEVA